ncbi:MAG: hypothetical protein PHS57_07880 [Alphaproteobacteria bacterium]|nr:hypothetical protein [Alphaproteobacteria bacterium]
MNLFLTVFPHILLVIGDDGIVVVPYGLEQEEPFFVQADQPLGEDDIVDFIDRYPCARLTLLADTLAQDFRSETLPPMGFSDRKKVLARRLALAFPSARLRAHLPFRKERNRFLLIGLHESNALFAWADRLQDRFPRIALLPVEGARLLQALTVDTSEPWRMMISRQKSGGFRQIVTLKGSLIFTRLTPPPADGTSLNEFALIARDIKATLEYLTRLGLRDPHDLSILILTATTDHNRSFLHALPVKTVRIMSPFDAAQRLRFPFSPERHCPFADLVFAASLLTRIRPTLCLMLPSVRSKWLSTLSRKIGLYVACFCLFLVSATALWRAGDLAAIVYRTQKEALLLSQNRHTLKRIQEQASPVTEPLGRLRLALERRHIYERPAPMPWRGLRLLTRASDEELIDLTGLTWSVNADASKETIALTLRLPTPEASLSDKRSETVETFTRLAHAIAEKLPDYTLTKLKPPYPAQPDETIQQETSLTTAPVGELSLQRTLP